jgi:hypothetical protein
LFERKASSAPALINQISILGGNSDFIFKKKAKRERGKKTSSMNKLWTPLGADLNNMLGQIWKRYKKFNIKKQIFLFT